MKQVKNVIKGVDKNGFTIALKGNTQRYVIGITHNSANVAYKKTTRPS